jgi:DNA-binding NtrC family response regulator
MKLRILVFDDDPELRTMLQTALSSKGHEVTALADPSEFPFINRESCPCLPNEPCADILIADNIMPNIEGIDFFKKLKKNGCHPLSNGNVAIMSGYLTIHYMNELNDLDIQYFRKPFKLSDIFDWVDECQVRIEGSLKTAAKLQEE